MRADEPARREFSHSFERTARIIILEARARAKLRVLILLLLLGVSTGCGGSNPTSPAPQTLSVSGTWDGQFSGTVQGAGTRQTDTFVMELRQDGANVSGTILYRGTNIPLPVSGRIEGARFTYDGRVSIAPNCEAVVRAETTIDGVRLSGQQTQSTCEGTAVGQMTATRR